MCWLVQVPPVVVDKQFAESLKRHARLIAHNVITEERGGKSLGDDVKRALRDNLFKLKDSINQGKVGRRLINEYKGIFKGYLTRNRMMSFFLFFLLLLLPILNSQFSIFVRIVKHKELDDLEVDDSVMMNVLEMPHTAFEIAKDPMDGMNRLRVKSAYLREQAKLVRSE